MNMRGFPWISRDFTHICGYKATSVSHWTPIIVGFTALSGLNPPIFGAAHPISAKNPCITPVHFVGKTPVPNGQNPRFLGKTNPQNTLEPLQGDAP